jgi:hypothetical protein
MDSSKPNHACRLNKLLYGLKQAPSAWRNRFVSYITSLGFVEAKYDALLFIYFHGADMVFLLLC